MKYLIGILAALMLSFSPAMAQFHHGVGPGFHGGWHTPVGPGWHGGWRGGGGPGWWGGRYYSPGVGPCWQRVPPLIGPWVWTCD